MASTPIPTLSSVPTASASAPAERKRPRKVLPTNRIALTKQATILRAWASISGPNGKVVTNSQVGEVIGMTADTISLANPFFADVGLLQKVDGGYVPAPATAEFNNAHEWQPETAAHRLAPVLREAWFAEALLPRLQVAPMQEADAISTLAQCAGVGPAHRQQLVACLEFLALAGLIEREGGQVRRIAQNSSGVAAEPLSTAGTAAQRDPSRGGSAVATSFAQGTPEGQVQFSIAVRVSMTEFAGWDADRIAAFFGGIAAVLAAKGGVELDAGNP
jgi:hypothetical protein